MYEPDINEVFITISVGEATICRYTKNWLGQMKPQVAKNASELAQDAYRAAWEFIQRETGISFGEMTRPRPNVSYPCPSDLAARAKW